jgi:hypothetical protein
MLTRGVRRQHFEPEPAAGKATTMIPIPSAIGSMPAAGVAVDADAARIAA